MTYDTISIVSLSIINFFAVFGCLLYLCITFFFHSISISPCLPHHSAFLFLILLLFDFFLISFFLFHIEYGLCILSLCLFLPLPPHLPVELWMIY